MGDYQNDPYEMREAPSQAEKDSRIVGFVIGVVLAAICIVGALLTGRPELALVGVGAFLLFR